LYAVSARDRDLLKAIVRIAPLNIAGAGLIVVAGFLHGPLKPLPWLAALGVGLVDRSGTPRIALARDVYTYLHLPMVAGIVLFAFAMKTTLGPHVSDELAAVPALALCGGPALYLFAYVALRFRLAHRRGWPLGRRGCLRDAVSGRARGAGDHRSVTRRRSLDRASRLRAHLVARRPGRNPCAMRNGPSDDAVKQFRRAQPLEAERLSPTLARGHGSGQAHHLRLASHRRRR
jgi:hypothetical protein